MSTLNQMFYTESPSASFPIHHFYSYCHTTLRNLCSW